MPSPGGVPLGDTQNHDVGPTGNEIEQVVQVVPTVTDSPKEAEEPHSPMDNDDADIGIPSLTRNTLMIKKVDKWIMK